MKLKIVQPGFETYSGQMGMILFKDGLSVCDVSERDALRLCALFRCVWEDDSEVKFTKLEKEPEAPIGRDTFRAPISEEPVRVGGDDGHTTYVDVANENIPPKVTRYYTLVELESIADNQGIKGLRAVAAPLGIRGTSINSLIEEIMKVAGKHVDAPEGVEIVE